METTYTELNASNEEAQRQQIQAELEAAITQLQAAMDAIAASSPEGTSSTAYQELADLLSNLVASQAQMTTGSPAILSSIRQALPTTLGLVTQAVQQNTQIAATETANYIMDMNESQIVHLQQQHYQASQQFQQFEQTAYAQLQVRALMTGTDISSFNQARAALQDEYEKAKGDLLAMVEADALRASNLRMGLEATGTPTSEIDVAIQQEQSAEKRYLELAAIDARKMGQQQGLTGQELAKFVEQTTQKAQEHLQDRKDDLSERHEHARATGQSKAPPSSLAQHQVNPFAAMDSSLASQEEPLTEASAPLPTPTSAKAETMQRS
uniref:RC130 n=1 Tax=Ruegeria sp. PR1b TaxID=185588 RepID=Q8KW60_9RHOB|nr:hypothetical protein [Ruegeria sp. PR1b]AAN05203.1 RC130 [Ruegeria sp. PR1b]